MVASKENADQFAEQQRNLRELMQKGATVLICPDCMKLYGVSESSLLPGIQIVEESDHG
jgi:intracellular sulfur oxidation DsrE/DsrF family protein